MLSVGVAITPPCGATDYASWVEGLQSTATSVQWIGEVDQPFFRVRGQRYLLDGEVVEAYQYPTPAAALTATNRVSTDGFTIGSRVVKWVQTPHFFHCHRLIVLYVGDEYRLQEKLAALLGPQVAGGVLIPDL